MTDTYPIPDFLRRKVESRREGPILFSAPMVRAILDGRKTVTRRVVNPQPPTDKQRSAWFEPGVMGWASPEVPSDDWHRVRCPYGRPGDRLWVRENFSGPFELSGQAPGSWLMDWPTLLDDDGIWYWADGNPSAGDWTKPRPSIHMPRWASRILLEIVAVRVERLQDISEADALAEGVTTIWPDGPRADNGPNHYTIHIGSISYNAPTAAGVYSMLWEQINGSGSWAENPWVWCLTFKRV